MSNRFGECGLRPLAERTQAFLRVVYIAFAMLLGVGFAVASVGYLWQGIEAAIEFEQCNSTVEPSSIPGGEIVTNCYGIDGPDPLSFESYGKGPVFAATFLLIAFSALKRRWEALSLSNWFLLAPVAAGVVASVFHFGWRSLLGLLSPESICLFIAIATIVVATRSASNSRAMSVQAVLATVVAVGYVWRAIAVAMSIEAVRAIGPLLGGHTFYTGAIDLVSVSIVGLAAAIALLITGVLSLWGRARALSAALAFTAGLSFPGFLQALDLVLGLQEGGYIAYVIQEAVAFVACTTALALTRRRQPSQFDQARALAS